MADAATGSKKLKCTVVTPETIVLEAEAEMVVFPAIDGEVGILPGRLPLVARLGYGMLRLKQGSSTTRLFVNGGFAQVAANSITLITPLAQKPESLHAADIEKKLADLMNQPATTVEAVAEKTARVSGLKAQLRVAGKA